MFGDHSKKAQLSTESPKQWHQMASYEMDWGLAPQFPPHMLVGVSPTSQIVLSSLTSSRQLHWRASDSSEQIE